MLHIYLIMAQLICWSCYKLEACGVHVSLPYKMVEQTKSLKCFKWKWSSTLWVYQPTHKKSIQTVALTLAHKRNKKVLNIFNSQHKDWTWNILIKTTPLFISVKCACVHLLITAHNIKEIFSFLVDPWQSASTICNPFLIKSSITFVS